MFKLYVYAVIFYTIINKTGTSQFTAGSTHSLCHEMESPVFLLKSESNAFHFQLSHGCNTSQIEINVKVINEKGDTFQNLSYNFTNYAFESGINFTVTFNNSNCDGNVICILSIYTSCENDTCLLKSSRGNGGSKIPILTLIAISVFVVASLVTFLYIKKSRHRGINLKQDQNEFDEETTILSQAADKVVEDHTHVLSTSNTNDSHQYISANESNQQKTCSSDNYVSEEGLLYVTIGDIENQTTRTSAGSVKSKKDRVQYQEIDFTKTGQIIITETENTNPGTAL